MAEQDGRQKRRLIRRDFVHPVRCLLEGEEFPAMLQDIGLEGMRLEVPRRIKVGSLLRVSLLGAGDTAAGARVIWCRKRRLSDRLEVGLVYQDSPENLERSWIKSCLDGLGFDPSSLFERRRTRRVEVDMDVVIQLPAGGELMGQVVNLGAGGIMVVSAGEFPSGTLLSLELRPPWPRAPVRCRAVVIYCRPAPEASTWHCGVNFVTEQFLQAYLEALGAQA